MKNVILATAGVAALALTAGAIAGGPDQAPVSVINSAAGFYLTGGVGYGKTDISPLITAPATLVSDTGVTFNVAGGYQFNKYIALEGGYIYLPQTKNIDDFGQLVRINYGAVYAAVKGIYPINSQFDVFGKAGAGYTVFSGTSNGITITSTSHQIIPLVGAGVDYYVTPHVAVTAQALYTIKAGNNFPATIGGTLGMTFKF